MPGIVTAKEPFKFFTRLHLSELTGLRATTLGQFCGLIKKVPSSSIYHHTHRFLQQHQYLSPEPPNDFAFWAADVLGEDELGERLASIDTVQYSTIRELRQKIAGEIDAYLNDNPLAKLKFARSGEEFHFIKSISFILPTGHAAFDLKGFTEILKDVTIDSIYFHIFESRLRLERKSNDFSEWIEESIGDKESAGQISRLDPYTRTLEDLKKTIINILERRIGR